MGAFLKRIYPFVIQYASLDGKWKINNKYLDVLREEAKELKKNFKDFKIRHVDREYNSAADILANKGVGLPEEKYLSTFPAVKKKIRTATDAGF